MCEASGGQAGRQAGQDLQRWETLDVSVNTFPKSSKGVHVLTNRCHFRDTLPCLNREEDSHTDEPIRTNATQHYLMPLWQYTFLCDECDDYGGR